jgi:Ca2+-transporting ATPase
MTREGLSRKEAQTLLEQFGYNALPEKSPTPHWLRFLRQFQSPLIYILLFALAVDIAIWIIEGATGVPLESITIGLILFINSGLGVYQENKASAALSKLRDLAAPLVWVVRDGKLIQIPGKELVPGDLLRIEAGDRVPADGNITEVQGLMVDESVLTGESIPVEKETDDEVFSGTLLVRGKGYASITRTGKKSAMGKLAVMIGGIEAGQTPLERRLDVFGKQIAYAIFALAFFLVIAGLYVEGVHRIGHVLLFAVALAVAAVPEGLPAVLTLTLSLGVERMAKRKAIVRRLSAVEALGSITIIATDKTGTLTENRMFVKRIVGPEKEIAFKAMILANDAEIGTGAGDPLELALLEFAGANGNDPGHLIENHKRLSVLPFDSGHKYMRVTVDEGGGPVSYLKGAPETILERCDLSSAGRQELEDQAEGFAREGYRVLAMARREGEGDQNLEFGGLALLWDPPRSEVPEAIRFAREAGIRVVMITGDHPATALAVATAVGIPPTRVLTGSDIDTFSPEALSEAVKEVNVFARVAPEHKLRLVETLQHQKEVVAVTGDGVNDAPALKRSDVGVAMGQRGSDVSREVSDLILMDDNFATIVAAIEEGRGIYENIQKFIRFLFSTNLALVLLVVGGAIGSFFLGLEDIGGGLLLPLTAVQLLWINIIADGPPALALGLDKNTGVMSQLPRSSGAPLLDRASLSFIVFTGGLKALAGGFLLMILPLLGYGVFVIRTAVFLFESIAQLFFAYPSRRISVIPKFNLALLIAVVLGVTLQFITIFVPFFRELLVLSMLESRVLLIVSLVTTGTWAGAEVYSRLALKWRVSH